MAITDLSTLLVGMLNGRSQVFLKASVTSQVTGHETSLWKAAGYPTLGPTPTTAAVCTNATDGAFALATRTGDQQRVVSFMTAVMGNAGHHLILEDRLMHMGGLVGNVITAQTVGLSIYANLTTGNLDERKGAADYSDVAWYLEWYADTGSTVSTPTCAVTYADGTTGTVGVWVLGATALPATVRNGRRYRLNPTNGKFIRSVETVTLSPSTGTAGNFGVTAMRERCRIGCVINNVNVMLDWAALGLPLIFDSSCLTLGQICSTTSTGGCNGLLHQAVA